MLALFYITAKVAEKVGDAIGGAIDVIDKWGDKFAEWIHDDD